LIEEFIKEPTFVIIARLQAVRTLSPIWIRSEAKTLVVTDTVLSSVDSCFYLNQLLRCTGIIHLDAWVSNCHHELMHLLHSFFGDSPVVRDIKHHHCEVVVLS